MDELPAELHATIERLCAEGDQLAEAKKFEQAIALYNQAWELVPEPKNHWNASTWILAAIGDAAFLSDYKTSALEAFEYAMTCPGAVGNPFLHLRLGQLLHDKGDLDRAADELMRAYMGAGLEVFDLEHPRYREFLRSRTTDPLDYIG